MAFSPRLRLDTFVFPKPRPALYILAMGLIFAAAIATFLASLVGTRLVLGWLRHRDILDHPNHRSSHDVPTPKGGGIAVIGALAATWTLLGPPCAGLMAGLALALAALSWVDDLRELGPLVRLLIQIAAVTAALVLWPDRLPVFGGLLPPVVDMVLAVILWVWFVNLFNFMDGVDGIAGTETVVIGLGLVLVTGLSGINGINALFGATLASAALGFLIWNWHPAKIFLGDVGSVPLGFLLGFVLLKIASEGQWAAALILPAYYLADATITLVHRGLRGEAVWRAHKKHFYQQAHQGGLSHARVSAAVGVAGAGLIVCAAVAASGLPGFGLAGGVAVTTGLFFWLAARR